MKGTSKDFKIDQKYFFNFLKKHNAYIIFIFSYKKQINNYTCAKNEKTITEFMSIFPPERWISSSFIWSVGFGGFRFWHDINKEWLDLIDFSF